MAADCGTAPGPKRWQAWAFDLVAVVCLVVAILVTFGHTVDDTFITMRYARNVIEGYGPVFNPGDRVEGYSSPLHLVVLVLLQLLPGGYVLLKVKLFSLLCIGLNFLVARRLLSLMPVTDLFKGLTIVAVGASYPLAMAGSNGLSTALTTLLTLLLALYLVNGVAVRTPWRAGVVGALLVFVRPEGLWTVGVMTVAFLLVRHPEGSNPGLRAQLRWVMGPAGFLVLLLAARLSYYGELLPNPYFAKRSILSRTVRTGVAYLARGIAPWARWDVDSGTVVIADLAVIAVAVAFVGGLFWCWRHRSVWLVVAAVPLAQGVFVVATGADWMMGSRFVAVAVVPGTVVIVLGIVAIGRWCVGSLKVPALTVRVLSVGLLVAIGVVGWVGSNRIGIGSSHGKFDDRSLLAHGGYLGWTEMVDLLGCAHSGEVVAMTEVGFTPWARGDLRFMDLSGLNDWYLARAGPREDRFVGVGLFEPVWGDSTDFVVKEVLRRRPETVIISAEVDPDSDFAREYREVDSVSVDWWELEAWRRRDLVCEP